MSSTQQIRQMMIDYDTETSGINDAFYKKNSASLEIYHNGPSIIRHLIDDNARLHKALHKLRGEQFTHSLSQTEEAS